jgi:carbonic anhydrase/acetyltransferase-like protein (isoleucine patch superfamily)
VLKQFEGVVPVIAASAFIDESAVIAGDVVIGEDSSVWPITAIRGDANIIRIGRATNIQDGSVLHGSHVGEFHPKGAELHIGDQVTVGHKVLLHGCRIGNQCLIGMGSIVTGYAKQGAGIRFYVYRITGQKSPCINGA